jgi:hypothetical protein
MSPRLAVPGSAGWCGSRNKEEEIDKIQTIISRIIFITNKHISQQKKENKIYEGNK